jgi:cobalt-zinc-cadmium efflux system outer membrane protein
MESPKFAASALLALAACASPRPDPEAEAAISVATGVDSAVTFRVEGTPLDEPAVPDGERLALADAVRRSIATDPMLQSALARVRVAMADADQAHLLPNPVLDFVVRFGQGRPSIEATLSASIVQMLQTPRRASAADKRLRQAAADAVTAALDVLSELEAGYAAVQASDELLPLLQARLEGLQRLVDLARLRANAGEGAEADVTTLTAQRVEVEVELAAARLEQRSGRLHLARLIGEPSGAAAWPLDPWSPPPADVDRDEESCIRIGLLHRPEVQSAAWQLASLRDERALAGLAPFADASLGATAQREPDWTVGPEVTAPLPLFDTGSAQRARATAAVIAAAHDLGAARRKVVEEVRVAHRAFADSIAILTRVQRELIPLQQRRREQAEFSYRAGQTDVTTLLVAEEDLRTALVRAIESERQTTLARVRLQRALGGPGAATAPEPAPTPEPDRSPEKGTHQ